VSHSEPGHQSQGDRAGRGGRESPLREGHPATEHRLNSTYDGCWFMENKAPVWPSPSRRREFKVENTNESQSTRLDWRAQRGRSWNAIQWPNRRKCISIGVSATSVRRISRLDASSTALGEGRHATESGRSPTLRYRRRPSRSAAAARRRAPPLAPRSLLARARSLP
jgi:hypothetical protein